MSLKVEDLASEILLNDQHDNMRSTSKFEAKSLVLIFYPKNNIPICTSQLCAFRHNYKLFSSYNSEIWGINNVNIYSHNSISRNLQLPFPILSDNGNKIGNLYGIKNIFGLNTSCITFVINEKKINSIHKNLIDSNSHVLKPLEILENSRN
tara:strand:- start:11783 stop:12235 length:453 start_codon:yes stop_codon:yes gene_type:complete